MSKTITIRLSEEEFWIKDKISELRTSITDDKLNPYFKRSESETAKMLLEEALTPAYKLHVLNSKES